MGFTVIYTGEEVDEVDDDFLDGADRGEDVFVSVDESGAHHEVA